MPLRNYRTQYGNGRRTDNLTHLAAIRTAHPPTHKLTHVVYMPTARQRSGYLNLSSPEPRPYNYETSSQEVT